MVTAGEVVGVCGDSGEVVGVCGDSGEVVGVSVVTAGRSLR